MADEPNLGDSCEFVSQVHRDMARLPLTRLTASTGDCSVDDEVKALSVTVSKTLGGPEEAVLLLPRFEAQSSPERCRLTEKSLIGLPSSKAAPPIERRLASSLGITRKPEPEGVS